MAAIKDLPYTLTSAGIADRTVVYFVVDKTDESPAPGKTMKITLDELAENIGADANPFATMEQTGHGLTAGNVGYALFGHAIFDDTAPDQWATGVFVEYLTTSTFRYAASGQSFTMPAARVIGSYSISSDGRFLFWDSSANGWKPAKPTDSAAGLPPLLMVNSYSSAGSGSYNVTFLGFGPLSV